MSSSRKTLDIGWEFLSLDAGCGLGVAVVAAAGSRREPVRVPALVPGPPLALALRQRQPSRRRFNQRALPELSAAPPSLVPPSGCFRRPLRRRPAWSALDVDVVIVALLTSTSSSSPRPGSPGVPRSRLPVVALVVLVVLVSDLVGIHPLATLLLSSARALSDRAEANAPATAITAGRCPSSSPFGSCRLRQRRSRRSATIR